MRSGPNRKFSIISAFPVILIFSFSCTVNAQSTYLPQGDKHHQFLDRMEIMLQKNADLNLFGPKSIPRLRAVQAVGLEDSLSGKPSLALSRVDQSNLRSLLVNNAEWITLAGDKKRTFYHNRANLVEINKPNFFLALNPVVQLQESLEQDNDDRVFDYTGGITMRGMIANRVGFYSYVTQNLERPPLFAGGRMDEFRSVPGAGLYNKTLSGSYEYIDARGGITFKALKYIDVQVAYDKNFIGNGYRSLFLSDFGNSSLFLKLNTRIWKINYQNLYMVLDPQFSVISNGTKYPFGKKYATMHHLNINATKWLNLGLFQAIIFYEDQDYLYLSPIPFLRISQLQKDNTSNSFGGFDFKANVAKKFQFYGQFLMDEFILKEIRDAKGWWGNRFGVQLGAKYINVFNIKNLDLQVEMNAVRPFTYSTVDSMANYTHFDQPLAHPLGANFMEGIGILRYQPHPKLSASARLIYWKQGVDSADRNFGGNIFKPYRTRASDYNFTIPSGVEATGLNAQFLLSYEIKENLFVDGSYLMRNMKLENNGLERNTSLLTIGLRMNMFRREYDY